MTSSSSTIRTFGIGSIIDAPKPRVGWQLVTIL
jgi:putative transposon-encoded protein